jgi:fructosamine-3-kinase
VHSLEPALLDPTVLVPIERAVSEHLGRPWTGDRLTNLADRSSHPAGILEGSTFSVFVKLSHATDAGRQFSAELTGLKLLRDRARVLTPTPIGPGVVDVPDGAVLLLEAIPERTGRTERDWTSIGRTLAEAHRVRADHCGLELFDGFFGPLPQNNAPASGGGWADFFIERRVLPRLRGAVDAGHVPLQMARDVERLMAKIPVLVGPEPEPALLHGDAQQNNFLSTAAGAVVIDAAPYYGHPEVDLAMLDFFAAVPGAVFDGYREVLSIDRGFPSRRELWRIPAYLAVVQVAGGNDFGLSFLRRLGDAVHSYS